MKTIFVVLFTFVFINIGLYAQFNMNIKVLDNPSPGYLRLDGTGTSDFYLLDNYGHTLFTQGPWDLNYCKLLDNGYWIRCSLNKYYLYNQDFQLVDSIANMTNYMLDVHDVILLSNGDYLLLCGENTTIDMSKYVSGGKTSANVTTEVLVEVNRTTNGVVWEWHAINHISPTDVTNLIDLTQQNIDLTHINSLFEDSDGNIIISIRHFDEVVKINKATGQFMWRIGGSLSKHNEFTFTNDTDENGFVGFSMQHCANLTNSGTLLLFDNGVGKPIQYSRAVEYQINFTNKTITKIWEYRYSPDQFSLSMGSAYRLPTGNTLINWGNGNVTEVRPNGSKAFDLQFLSHMSYRAYRYITQMNAVIKSVSSTGNYVFDNSKYTTGVTLNLSSVSGSGNIWIEKHNYKPYTSNFIDSSFSHIINKRWVISSNGITNFAGTIKIRANSVDSLDDPNKVTIYKRDKENYGYFSKLNTTFNSTTGEITANFTGGGEFILCSDVLDVPKLSLPLNNTAFNTSDILSWLPVPGALKYDIQIDTLNTFINPIADYFSTSNTQALNNLLNGTTYYWRVRALNDKDTSSWSGVYSFMVVLAKPTLTYPENFRGAVSVNDALKWDKVKGAQFYWVQTAFDADFRNLVFENNKIILNQISPGHLQNFTTYYWRVKAVCPLDSSDWSDVYSFTTQIEIPKLTAPNKDTVNIGNSVTFNWQNVKGATNYIIRIGTDEDFLNQIYLSSTTNDSLAYTPLQLDTKYYWSVCAVRGNDTSNWSDIWAFSTLLNKVKLVYPQTQTINIPLTITFNWESPANADYYALQISKNSNFTELVVDTNKILDNSYNNDNLEYNTKYYWRVKVFLGKRFSDWSDTWYFTTVNTKVLTKPNLINPPQFSWNIKDIDFSWSQVDKAEQYKLQIAKDYRFSSFVIDTLLSDYKDFNYDKCNPLTRYFWRVCAIRGTDTSDWSNANIFYVVFDGMPIMLFYPGNDNLSTPINGVLSWLNIANVDTYDLQMSVDSSFVNNIYDVSNIDTSAFTYNNLKMNTKYYWRVRYEKNSLPSNWSFVFHFTTITPDSLPRPNILSPTYKDKPVSISGKLVWSSIPKASSYTISISSDYYFFNEIQRIENIKDTTLDYQSYNYNQFYYWRVSAKNDQAESPWSYRNWFLTEMKSPQIVYPSENEIISLIGNIKWNKQDSLTTYQLQIATDPDFNNLVVDRDSIYYEYYGYSLEKGQYYCRVRSYNMWNLSDWSNPVPFSVSDVASVESVPNNIFEVNPNPIQDFATVIVPDELIGQKIEIYNILGNLVYADLLAKNQMNIGFKNLPAGTYFFKIGNLQKMLIKM
jgi:hypothetical protein